MELLYQRLAGSRYLLAKIISLIGSIRVDSDANLKLSTYINCQEGLNDSTDKSTLYQRYGAAVASNSATAVPRMTRTRVVSVQRTFWLLIILSYVKRSTTKSKNVRRNDSSVVGADFTPSRDDFQSKGRSFCNSVRFWYGVAFFIRLMFCYGNKSK